MGRMLKNTVFKSASYSARIPAGSDTIGPDSPVSGMTRFNSSNNKLEFYNNQKWNAIAQEGTSAVLKEMFVGDNESATVGPMAYSYASGQEAQVLVFVNTVYQNPGVNYTFNGTSMLSFSAAPAIDAQIIILHNMASTIVV